MKEYIVNIDITMSRKIRISAEHEEEAKRLALNKVVENPYPDVSTNTLFVGAKVIDVLEE